MSTTVFVWMSPAAPSAASPGTAIPRARRPLRAAGPSLLDDARGELGLDTKAMRKVRQVTESRGAVVSREVTVPARNGGHLHTSELRRWDQTSLAGRGTSGSQAAEEDPLADLTVGAVRAAVVAPVAEATSWL